MFIYVIYNMKDTNFTSLLKEFITEILATPADGRYFISKDDSSQFVKKLSGAPWMSLAELPDGRKIRCYSVYKINRRFNTEDFDVMDVIKAIKDPSLKGKKYRVHEGVVDHIIDEAVDLSVNWIERSGWKFETIVTPQSSKTLAVRFANKIGQRMGVKVVPAVTMKNMKDASVFQDLPASFSEETKNSLYRSLERFKEKDPSEQEIKKIPAQFRKFIVNWQKKREKAGAIGPENSGVLVVDDKFTGGSTIAETSRILENENYNVVGCLTLFVG